MSRNEAIDAVIEEIEAAVASKIRSEIGIRAADDIAPRLLRWGDQNLPRRLRFPNRKCWLRRRKR
jgi:hypothetical protein